MGVQQDIGEIKRHGRTEGKVESLGGEVSNDVGGVSSPERNKALFTVCAGESIANTLVGGS